MKRTLLLLTSAGLALLLMSSLAFAQGCCSSSSSWLQLRTQGQAPYSQPGSCCSVPGTSPTTTYRTGVRVPTSTGLPSCCAGTGYQSKLRQAVRPSGGAIPTSYSPRPYQAPARAGRQNPRPILVSKPTTSALPSCCQTPTTKASGRIIQAYNQGPTQSLSALLAGQRRGPVR
jgi:hypothetical protein